VNFLPSPEALGIRAESYDQGAHVIVLLTYSSDHVLDFESFDPFETLDGAATYADFEGLLKHTRSFDDVINNLRSMRQLRFACRRTALNAKLLADEATAG